jgi:ligand-binding sensor domain-containing protein
MLRLLIIIFCILGSATLIAQPQNFHFHHIRESEGLSNNFVLSFLKDTQGQFWMGTLNGLERFDGIHHFPYRRSRKPGSIPDNVINDLCEDKTGTIWGATSNGIFSFNKNRTQFKAYATPVNRFAKSIRNIICDRYGTVWATSEWNTIRYDRKLESFVALPGLAHSNDSLIDYAPRKNGLVEDPLGRGIWIATRNGLHLFNSNSNQYTNFRNNASALFRRDNFSALSLSKRKTLFVFSNSRHLLLEFDPASEKFIDSFPLSNRYKNAIGCTSFEDHTGRIWLSTWSEGIIVLNRNSAIKEEAVLHANDKPLTIAGDFVWQMYEDEDGAVWLGTNEGLSICNPEKELFRVHYMRNFDPKLSGASINELTENATDGSWWVLYEGINLMHYNVKNGSHELFSLNDAEAQPEGLRLINPHRIRVYGDTLFLCAYNGVWFLAPGSKKITPFRPFKFDKKIDKIILRDYVRLNDGRIFFNSHNQIFQWDAHAHSAQIYSPSIDSFPDGQKPFFDYLLNGADGQLWFVASYGWLGQLNKKNEVVYTAMYDAQNPAYNGYFTSLAADRFGTFWLSKNGAGLVSYHPVTRKLKNYYQSDGLITDNIQKTIPDKNGKIWIISGNKLSILDPLKNAFRNLEIPISTSNRNFDNQFIQRSTNHNLLAAVNLDIIEFFPDRLTLQPQTPKVAISSISINGRDSFLFNQSTLNLKPNERSLNIKFGLLTNREIFPYQLLYQLEGVDTGFRVAGAMAAAEYPNLPNGHYRFLVKAVAADYSWESSQAILSITIQTPFYKQSWFYLFLILLVGSAVYWIYHYRSRQREKLTLLETKAQLLEKEKALVMYESLKQQLNPHFLFNSLTSLSSLIRFDTKQATDFLDKMSKVYRYILQNREKELVTLSEELRFIQIFIGLQQTRFEDGLKIDIQIDEHFYHRKIVPVTLQNLVENAIKHNIADSDLPLLIEIFISNDYLVVRNNLQRKRMVETSNRQGLRNMESLYQYLDKRPLIIEETAEYFTVKIPLI